LTHRLLPGGIQATTAPQQPTRTRRKAIMLRALAVIITILFTAPALAADQTVKASNDSSLQVLSQVFDIHNLSDDKRGVMLRLFESGGGDPAVNGNHLMLAIVPEPSQAPRVWQTGIDIYKVRSVALDAEKPEISIDATEHFQGDQGAIGERPRHYTIRYDIDAESGAVSETIRIRDDEPS
jgi:hypothetical protein